MSPETSPPLTPDELAALRQCRVITHQIRVADSFQGTQYRVAVRRALETLNGPPIGPEPSEG